MDIQMPNVDGYEDEHDSSVGGGEQQAAHADRALTASALEEAVHRTKEAGCDAHITKPVKKSTLLDAIRDAVEGSASDDEGASGDQSQGGNMPDRVIVEVDEDLSDI